MGERVTEVMSAVQQTTVDKSELCIGRKIDDKIKKVIITPQQQTTTDNNRQHRQRTKLNCVLVKLV